MRPFQTFLFALLLAIASAANAQVNLTMINSSYHQNFDSLLSSGTTNDIATLPHGWSFVETGSNANTTYAASTGSANAGNTYSFGLTGERALGGLQSGTLIPIVGASFINQTGSTITSIEFTYRGEQWRVGTTGRVMTSMHLILKARTQRLQSGRSMETTRSTIRSFTQLSPD
jgi:hypothetical protein